MRLAILDDYQDVALDMADWHRLPDEVEISVFNDHLADETALAERLAPFEMIAVMRERTPFPRALLQRLPRLRLLLTGGMKNAALDLDAAAECGVTVCGSPSPGHATAELTWGLILALSRHLPAEERALRAGRWQTRLGRDLHGKTLGLLGLGRLGRRVAAIGAAFGMRVVAWSAKLDAATAAEHGAEYLSKDALLADADVVSIHLRLGERSRGLIGARELALMKPTALLINTSRAPIVDRAALLDALRERRIGGAGLDVFDVEPLAADEPLLALDNVVLSPHIGFVTEETYRVFYSHMVENILAFLDGEPRHRLNP